MGRALLDAFSRDDRGAIHRLAPYRVPDEFPGDAIGLVRFRREQLARDPARAPWLLRAIVRRSDSLMVGYVNFHGPPGVNDTGTRGAVELGWTVFPDHRRQGYATETATGLMEWAAREHHIAHFISSTTEENLASLRVHEKLGFRRTGEIVDGEVIFELRC
jgi:RimJ/RimL family protein N-acetyltransferase